MKVFGKVMLTAVAAVAVVIGLCCVGGEISRYWENQGSSSSCR